MDKKQFLIDVLTKLENDWLPAGGFKIIIEEGKLSEEIMDVMILVIQQSLKDSDNIAMKDKLEKSIEMLEKVKMLEADSKAHDEQDIKELENMLDQL